MTFFKQIGGAALGAAMLLGAGLCAPPAQAAYIVDLTQVGANVVATGSGTLDLAGLTFFTDGGNGSSNISPLHGFIFTGSAPSSFDDYRLVTGPTSFGGGGMTFASSGSGDDVGIDGEDSLLIVPAGYGSGNPLSSSATWDGQTLASLGVTPGTYLWTWSAPATAADDSFTLNITAAAVPEPSSILLLGLPLGLVLLLALRQSRPPRAA